MLKKCDLKFKENAILTKEMLWQMNNEPKWLLLDNLSNVSYGIISGFEFIDEGMDKPSKISKGNIIIDGDWYRLNEDYIFAGDSLKSGQQYFIMLIPVDEGYSFILSEKGTETEGIKIAGFKYEFSEHERVFRVPHSMLDFKKSEAYIKDVDVPYYNLAGIRICPQYISDCIKESLALKDNRNTKEEIIYHTILNSGNISIDSIYELIGMKEDVCDNSSLIDKLVDYFKKDNVIVSDRVEKTEEINSEEVVKRNDAKGKRSRRLGSKGVN